MKFSNFEYHAPASPVEVVELLSQYAGEAKIIAGGQSLLPTMAYRMAQPAALVDLKNVPDLNYISLKADGVHIGARTRWRDIEDSEVLARAHPLLQEAVHHVAHYQIRNRGTVGGSLAHGDPASELPCIAVTCDAQLRILGPKGERTIKADGFFTGPLSTELAEDEMILAFQLPFWPAQRRWAFQEFARRAGDFAMAGIALFYDLDAQQRATNVHIGVVGACSTPRRLGRAEAALNGKKIDAASIEAAACAASDEVDPTTDIHATAAYRRSLVATLLKRSLKEAQERVSTGA
ncbi:Carbon monoxide dehydrogenase medium chain [Variovorax sp. PBS-H4]|uniref:FAD binding domain-containing protein n=1 Tax=Variovorax sp. PBS-H4 TaxID=434008 RepID=UPI001315B6DF|nr:xanthine dehydrogenase family protein subunit M [Variovorax sp. PBS-H4]VTU36094.1 Carbon monoxide dehydrogenase medium chain [Variovorax sp. PBS-H4]